MKRIIRMAIRKVVNWAYGTDLAFDLIILFQAKENISAILKDAALRAAIKGGLGVKEDEL